VLLVALLLAAEVGGGAFSAAEFAAKSAHEDRIVSNPEKTPIIQIKHSDLSLNQNQNLTDQTQTTIETNAKPI
jgi:hypothetical protein